ncbi:MAG TPA: hypothetical protein VGZ22_01575, partial [Isosphaeraceae bacterium]|nr:hypothetical protein [Isosphaeraceae bacterium]
MRRFSYKQNARRPSRFWVNPVVERLEGRQLLAVGFGEVPLPLSNPFGPQIGTITPGPDGNMWFTELFGSKIGRITPTGDITEFQTPAEFGLGLNAITTGPDGNLWFTDPYASKIGRMTTTGVVTEFPLDPKILPVSIVTGPDGNLWFTENTYGPGGKEGVGRITPAGVVTLFPLADIAHPTGITAGADGNLWFSETGSNQVGRITPSGTITEFAVPRTTPFNGPTSITAGPDGNVWFANGNSLGRITPGGDIKEFPVSTGVTIDDSITSVTTGPDGALWFTTSTAGGSVGRMALDGTVTELPTPTLYTYPGTITAGPDGNLWFGEIHTNHLAPGLASNTYTGQIGQVILNPTDPALTVSGVAPIHTVEGWVIAGPDTIGQITEKFSGPVATFTDADLSGMPGDYTARIDWGDGRQPTNGTIESDGHGGFIVNGAHTYNEEGSYTIKVTVYDTKIGTGGASGTATTPVTVADPPLTLQGGAFTAAPGQNTSYIVASGTLGEQPGEFTVTIDWGDGSAPTTGTVSINHMITTDTGDFYTLNVYGLHNYAALGQYTVHATINDDGGAS